MNVSAKHLRIMLIGHTVPGALELSYQRAFAELGYQVELFDISQTVARHVKLGKIGRIFNSFVPVEPWIRKANRDLFQRVRDWQPQIVISLAQYPLRPGTLAQIKASATARLVYIWPDTLINWNTDLSVCLPLYDLVATYSQATVTLFRQMGARQIVWAPLAGDPTLHQRLDPALVGPEYQSDVSFVGGWRPEREALLSQLGDLNLKIWGPDWGRYCRNNPVIRRAWQQRAVRGNEFSKVVAGSRVNLNIIDVSNYPAANMRFFEIPMAGGLQVCSSCPEMESEFRHGDQIFYYQHDEDLLDLIHTMLKDESRRRKVAAAAYDCVMAKHQYRHRAQAILDELSLIA